MIRLLAILIGAALVAAGIAWIADRQGELLFTIDNLEVRTSASVAIGLGILAAFLIGFGSRVMATILGTPGAVGRWTSARRMRRGQEALQRGLVAAAAGDSQSARKEAGKVHALLGSPPLALLLTAQAAQLDGDETGQSGAYRAMLEHPETEFLGLRGLFMQAMRRDDHGEAMKLAARAHELKPRAAWSANALFDLKSANREWSDAKGVLEESARAKLIDPGLLRRRRAVLLAAEALDSEARGDGSHALSTALEALDLSPSLAPAAALAARKLASQGRSWRAQDVIEAAWSQSPHPDLAATYAVIKPEEPADARARRLIGLAHLNRDHFESRILEAEQAVTLMNWAEARRLLAPMATGFASARVCALMAEIEQGERHDATAAHAWLSRAVRAPHDAEWRCSNCSWSSPQWNAVCGSCGAFDSLSWSSPDEETLENMPGAALDARLGMDSAAHVFLHADSDGEDSRDERMALEKPSPRTAPKTEDALDEGGFVVLPRPPDDPGPEGDEFEPASAIRGGGV
ncbi:MAG: heme biosynthesis protein HemY [Proteobacteria bacterium]|nr:heme biosynthesis protein HemY [Pseudomonadota bacterium]